MAIITVTNNKINIIDDLIATAFHARTLTYTVAGVFSAFACVSARLFVTFVQWIRTYLGEIIFFRAIHIHQIDDMVRTSHARSF